MAVRPRSIRSFATGVVACISFMGQAALAQVDAAERIGITDVAPTNTFVVVSVPDYPAAKAAMDRSEVGKLWARPEVRSFFSSMFKEQLSEEGGAGGLWGWFSENIDTDELHEPVGPVGMALFSAKAPNPDDAAEELDLLQALMIADFGEEVDALTEVINDALDRLEREGRITLDEDDHDDVEIRIVTIVQEEEEDDPELAALQEEFGGGPDRSMDAFKTILIATASGHMVVSTDRAALERSLDRIAGRKVEAIGESATYRSAVAQHPPHQHAMVVALVSEYVRTGFQEGFGDSLSMLPFPVSPGPLIESLGLTAIEAAGMGVRFDTDAGSLEQSLALLAPQKKGLLTLIDSSLPRFDPPAFVPADAMSAWSVALRFDRLSDLVRSLIRAFPPEMHEQGLTAFDQTAAPILASLGAEMHIVQTLSRPLGPASAASFVAIRLQDPLTFANSINGFAPMLGLTPRAFEGNQLFENDGAGLPTIGIGFDHAFIGPTEAVENAMRLASRPDTPRLTAADRFTRATAPLGAGGAVYYYDNMDESLVWSYWSMENAEKAFAAQLEEWGMDDETREEFLGDFRENQPKWQKDLPPMQVILDHIGDSVMELRPTPDGFRGRVIILRPAAR